MVIGIRSIYSNASNEVGWHKCPWTRSPFIMNYFTDENGQERIILLLNKYLFSEEVEDITLDREKPDIAIGIPLIK